MTVKGRKITIDISEETQNTVFLCQSTDDRRRGKLMRKKRFLAVMAAIAISMTFMVPATIHATEADVTSDTEDDEQEEGEQTTIIESGAEEETNSDSSSNGNSSGGSSGNTNRTDSAKSSDSSLSHLSIAPGSISPAFSAGTHEYTASVDADVRSISVAARPTNSKAVIASVSGAKSLSPGKNTVKVVVEAENGATTTYTITVNCGSSGSDAAIAQPSDTTNTIEGQISDDTGEDESASTDDVSETQKNKSEVKFDANGYLIYEGNAYIPSEMMPEGEYVSLEKYNKLYEQVQEEKTKNVRVIIILVIVLALLLIVILNLALKLRDARQDAKLGLSRWDGDTTAKKKKDVKVQKDNKTVKERKAGRETRASSEDKSLKAAPLRTRVTETDTSMIPDVKMPEQMRTARPAKQEKVSKTSKKAEDLEILDLNDL